MAKKDEKKPVQIHFRLSQKEYDSIKHNSLKAGLTISEYARRALVGEKIVSAPPADFSELIREIKRVGSNLNQLVRKLNALGIVHDLELKRCVTDISKTIDMLYQTFRPGKGEN